MADLARLQSTLGRPELHWLLQRLRRRLQRGGSMESPLTVLRPTPDQRSAVDRLLGRPPSRGTVLTVPLDRLDQMVRHAELAGGLSEAVELLTGPIVDVRAQQARQAAQWQELFDAAGHQAARRPPVQQWLDELRSTGLLRRLSGQDLETARTLLNQALQLLARLPARGVPLAELAAAVTGDSHALDSGRPLATLAVRAAARLGQVESWDDAEGRRSAWAGVGVLCDELSAPVLTLNLPAQPQSLTGQALQLHRSGGEPYRLSIRQLLRDGPPFGRLLAGRRVYVCENPTVLAAAANRLGPASAPLVCVEGQPSTAARLLLDQLAAAGAQLAYHGDFDWPGIHIANLILRRHGATPWRFDTTAYLNTSGGTRLEGTPVTACWDNRLQPAMLHSGRAVHEEQTLDQLLEDLEGG